MSITSYLARVTALIAAVLPPVANATWSIIATDGVTRRVAIASATCVSQTVFAPSPFKGLMDAQAIVVPGVGVAAAQASVDPSRANQALIYRELQKGTDPAAMVQMLRSDPAIQDRQFGILDVQGRFAGFSGTANPAPALLVHGQVAGPIYYSIQGNTLRSKGVVEDAARAFQATSKPLTDRVMAAMRAANAAGGDRRCSCQSEPLPKGPCSRRNAIIAYILAADPGDVPGTTQGDAKSHNGGRYALFLYVSDENTQPNESVDPVATLDERYQVWKEKGARRR